MDLSIISTEIVALLFPYLAKVSEGSAEALGKKAPAAVAKIFEYIVQKFKGDQSASEALEKFVQVPTDGERQAAFQGQLTKAMELDETFAESLRNFLNDSSISNLNIAKAGAGAKILQQSGQGNTGTIN
jgi:hypothetical protein